MTSSWWEPGAPDPPRRCCSPARATASCSSTGPPSPATRSQPTSFTQPGFAALNRWGLLDQLLSTGCPLVGTYAFDFGPFTIAGSPGTDDSPVAYAPRRTVLDKLLVDTYGGRVTGIRGHGHGGHVVSEHADGSRGGRAALGRRRRRETSTLRRQATTVVRLLRVLERLPTVGRFENYIRPIAAGPPRRSVRLPTARLSAA